MFLRGFIKDVLFNPFLVCCTLIAGGLVLMVIDELKLERTQHDATRFPLPMYVGDRAVPVLGHDPGRVALRGTASARC